MRLVDVADPEHPSNLATIGVGDKLDVATVTFSGDGTTLAINAFAGSELWDITDAHHPRSVHGVPYADSIAFGPAKIIAISIVGSSSIQLWSIIDPDHPSRLATLTGSLDLGASTMFSPDGRILAVAYTAATWLWDVSDPRHPTRLSTFTTGTAGDFVAFSGDGHTVATSDEPSPNQGAIHLWDISDAHHPVIFATIASGPLMAFGPAGELAAVWHSANVDLWPVQPSTVAGLLCADSGDAITRAQWDLYVPNLPYQPPCR